MPLVTEGLFGSPISEKVPVPDAQIYSPSVDPETIKATLSNPKFMSTSLSIVPPERASFSPSPESRVTLELSKGPFYIVVVKPTEVEGTLFEGYLLEGHGNPPSGVEARVDWVVDSFTNLASDGIRSVQNKLSSLSFVKSTSKVSGDSKAGAKKKVLRGEFQLLFDFVNKGTSKQRFTMTTLIENECMEGKCGTKSQVSKLLDVQECLSKTLEDMRITVATRDDEIS
ncbi:hypothetical protein FXO38_29470 [Capsicum annuum]|nr:hypothetical protein FXO38_29470 [Capsicum annuum]